MMMLSCATASAQDHQIKRTPKKDSPKEAGSSDKNAPAAKVEPSKSGKRTGGTASYGKHNTNRYSGSQSTHRPSGKTNIPEPYVERTETKKPGEEYDFKGKFDDTGLAIVKLRGKYGFINQEGVEVVPLKYDDFYCDGYKSNVTDHGWPNYIQLMSVSQNGKWGFVNLKGEQVIPPIYSNVQSIVYEDDISILCKKDGKWGAVGQDGTIHIPFVYDELGSFYNGHPTYAKKDGKYGYVDEYNHIIAPFIYSSTIGFPYEGSLAEVGENGRHGYIDLKGHEAIPLKYDFAGSFDFIGANKTEDALAGVVINKKLGFINGKGEEIIPCQYEYETEGNDNHKTIKGGFMGPTGLVKNKGKWGIINRKGELLVPLMYDSYSMRSTSGENDLVKDGKTFYFDKGGNMYSTDEGRRDSSTTRLAMQGFPDKQASIGEYYYRGTHGYPKDYEKALTWFNKAASQNNGLALYFLGWMNEFGQGVEQNYSLARDYYLKCINASGSYIPGSLLRLGHLYYYGKGVIKNYYDAYQYFYQSAELGDKEAMYYVGFMNEHGQGVDKTDIEKAKAFYKKSADKGYGKAKEKISEFSSNNSN